MMMMQINIIYLCEWCPGFGIKSIYDHLSHLGGIFGKDFRDLCAVQIYKPEIIFLYVFLYSFFLRKMVINKYS